MNRIIWKKWCDPLAALVYGNEDEDPDALSANDDFYEDDEVNWQPQKTNNVKVGPCIVGPSGIVPMSESNIPSKLYNFWMGHANFDLGNGLADKIANVDGVETFDCFTRYRFRIAVGHAFSSDEVKEMIDAAIQVVPEAPRQTGQDAVKHYMGAKKR